MEKIDMFRMFHKDIEIIDVSSIDIKKIPEIWNYVFSDNTFENQKENKDTIERPA